jgi:hemolysin activation/secretion protein
MIMKHSLSLVLISALSSSVALAAPDAGTIQRDIEKNLEKQQQLQKPSQKLEAATKEDTVKAVIKSFKFTGNTIIPTSELETIVAPYIGKELGFNALQKVVAEVSDYYASQGGLAKVYLPKQDITGGLVSIAIVEGKLNSVIIDNKEAKLSTPTAENYIYSQNAKNTPIKNKELSRALMNLNDLGGLKATSSLAPGAAEGSSDLVVKLKDGAKYSADVGVDNYGSKSTGFDELSAGVNVNNISRSDLYDSLNVRGMMTQGVRFARLAYSLPVGYYGDKIGLSQSVMTYRLVSGDINGDGSSATTAVNWSHPFVRSREFNINLNNELSNKTYNDQAAGSATDKRVTVLNSTLSFDKADAFLGGGQNSASVAVALGKVKKEGDGFVDTNNINGNYLKYSLNMSRQQYISDTLSLQASINAQMSNKNLDGSEDLSLGGANAVRAYPTSEVSGDMGYMASVELKYAFNSELTPSLFVDYGRVVINKSNLAAAGDNANTIGGYGLGLGYVTSYNLSVKGQISRRVATGYNPNSNDTNSDGSKSTGNRYWVNASYFF